MDSFIVNVLFKHDYNSLMSKESQEKLKTFNQFHSERQQTIQLTNQKTTRIKRPQASLSHSSRSLQSVNAILKGLKVSVFMVQISSYQCLYINDKQLLLTRLSFADKFKKMFMCKQPPKFILTVKTHEFLGVRAVIIKPIKANSILKSQSLSSQQLDGQMQKIAQLLQKILHLSSISYSEGDEQSTDYKYDIYSLDAISHFMFSKMLTDQKYSLGQKINAVNFKFSDKLKIQTSSKEDIKWLNEALNQISDTLLQGFNCSRKELTSILAFCRQSVEEYFHSIHQQNNANQEKNYSLESTYYTNEIRELQAILPQTFKQLHKLEKISTSMNIMNSLYMIGLIFKVECSIRLINDQTKNRCLLLIKTCYSNTMSDKTNMLKKSGYSQEDYLEYIQNFHFDEVIV